MFPESKPPQDVVDLVNQYKQAPTKFELLIFDNMFYLYELTVTKPEDEFNPAATVLGPLVKRAYWRDAAGISLDMMKNRLGIR